MGFVYDGVLERMCASAGGGSSFAASRIDRISSDQWDEFCIEIDNPAEIGNLDLTIEVYTDQLGTLDPTAVNVPSSAWVVDPANPNRFCADLSMVALPGEGGLGNTEGGIRVTVNKNGGGPVCVEEAQAKWSPVTDLLFSKVTNPSSIQSGEDYIVTLQYSVNFVDAENLVVWDELPTCANGGVTVGTADTSAFSNTVNVAPCGIAEPTPQDATILQSASAGAMYCGTPGGCLVSGVMVPENSVYWDLGNVPEGTTVNLQFAMEAPDGTINGTEYMNIAGINASNRDTNNPNNPIMATNVSVVTSAPEPEVNKYFNGGTFVLGMDTYSVHNRQVCYRLQYGNGSEFGLGQETMYCSYLLDDLTGLYANNVLDTTAGNMGITSVGNGGVVLAPGQVQTLNCGIETLLVTNTSPNPAIFWDLGTLPKGSDNAQGFRVCVQLTGDTSITGGPFENTATFGSIWTDPVSETIGFNLPPFPCGDLGIVRKYHRDYNECFEYGDPVVYALEVLNDSPFDVGRVCAFDKLDTNLIFQSATITSGNSNGFQVLYHDGTFTNLTDNPPDFDQTTGMFMMGAGQWQATAPAAPIWVAICANDLTSVFSNGYRGGTVDLVMQTPPPPAGDCCISIDVPRNNFRGWIRKEGRKETMSSILCSAWSGLAAAKPVSANLIKPGNSPSRFPSPPSTWARNATPP